MTESTLVWRVSVRVPVAARLAAENMLQSCCAVVTSFEVEDDISWKVEGFTINAPDRLALELAVFNVLHACQCDEVVRLKIDLLPERDWLAHNLASFSPLSIGRYFIFGSHMEAKTPAGAIKLLLDPGTAFGSGEHATTSGCLKILDQLAKFRKFRRPLDMGCGSGILALAMAKTWRRLVFASDLDSEAIRVTRINARKNQIAPLMRTARGIGFRSQFMNRALPFDLIVANILARPLIAMAADLERHLQGANDGGGTVVLSGFLERDARWVIAAYKAHGLTFKRIRIFDGWATLVLER